MNGGNAAGEAQADAAHRLYAGAFHGVLSTQSLDHPGYPFGSLVPYALDADGLVVLLLSHLAQHTCNLAADPRCALTLAQAGGGDVQQRARLSAIGDVELADPGQVAARYLRYYPHTRPYFEELGFVFHRFRPARFHWNGGFATARWFSADRLVRRNPLTADRETALLEELNRHHGTDLRVLVERARGTVATGATAVGIDSGGVDLRLGEELWRLPLPRRGADPADARALLADLARA